MTTPSGSATTVFSRLLGQLGGEVVSLNAFIDEEQDGPGSERGVSRAAALKGSCAQ